jgi:hypothetical protein
MRGCRHLSIRSYFKSSSLLLPCLPSLHLLASVTLPFAREVSVERTQHRIAPPSRWRISWLRRI